MAKRILGHTESWSHAMCFEQLTAQAHSGSTQPPERDDVISIITFNIASASQLEQGDQLSATFHLQRLLKQSAQTHSSLMQLASATAVDVPPEAALAAGRSTNEELGPRVLQWSDYVAAGAADWQEFDDEGVCHDWQTSDDECG